MCSPITRIRSVVLAAFALVLAACGQAAPVAPTGPLTPQQQAIIIDVPFADAPVASPFQVRGRTALFPQGGQLTYRVYDAQGAQVGTGTIAVAGAPGQAGAFADLVSYSAAAGAGRLEVLEINQADGAVLASSAVTVALGGGAGAATPVPGTPALPTLPPATAEPTAGPTAAPLPTAVTQQQILIETPPAGVLVGSPMTITGRTTMWPFQGSLAYRVVDAGNRQVGAGSFPVAGSPGQPATFSAAISFTLPASGGPIRVEVYDQNAQNNLVTASTALSVVVETPQKITFDTPPPGTLVGSPVVVTGRTARYPYQGNLAYRIIGPSGAQLGQGVLPVSGAPGQPGSFSASLAFALPPDGGAVRVELIDEDSDTGQVAARAALDLNVSPQSQQVFIDSPPAGVLVGSPMTITGRARRFPERGMLAYTVRDRSGVSLGAGNIQPTRAADGSAVFNASITFTLPPQGGAITVSVGEPIANGGPIGVAELPLQVAPQVTPTSAPPAQQQILIDTPPPGTVVGSPVVITGRVARAVNNGRLYYTIATASNQILADGEFSVPPNGVLTFTQQLFFTLPPGGGTITIRIFERDSGGAPTAEARVQLQVAPQIQPRTP